MVLLQTGDRSGTPSKPIVAKYTHGRELEKMDVVDKSKALHLLDLPLDILQAVISKITHTNDLTSLALTHSILHGLVTPYIYSRFDIVWPDAGPAIESRAGVDALTYGLATLVMAHDVFGERSYQQTCEYCTSQGFCQHSSAPKKPRKTRRGNSHALFTKKFSLGNGPEEWVKEYLITKEGGKMLGTLVALAVGRMRNLESFTWDMPTGVLRDVWLALASLDDRDDGEECHLERVWVRWHDNNQDNLPSAPTLPTDSPQLLSHFGRPSFRIPPYPRTEFPTFSILSALKSLTVLDIDELSYVEELSILVERSLLRLQELRIGLAYHAQNRAWARPREDRSVVPPLPPSLTNFDAQVQRPGGLLGILVSRFCTALSDSRRDTSQSKEVSYRVEAAQPTPRNIKALDEDGADKQENDAADIDLALLGSKLATQSLDDEEQTKPDTVHAHNEDTSCHPLSPQPLEIPSNSEQKLKLEVLELERVYLSVPVLSHAFHWSRLRALTILGCRDHEQFWKTLRKRFAPQAVSRSCSLSKQPTPGAHHTRNRSLSESLYSIPAADYELSITRIHTNTVSPALLGFLRDALAPDTLEHLFLQQSSAYKSSVTIDQIYKYAVRRHRFSLKKLLIDSEIRNVDGAPDNNMNWRKWALSRELITCITSGRMHLRELSLSIDYKDWHYFLQRLPNALNLRSIHIGHIADHVHSRHDPREAALQILDIVALRPELQLCYIGIQDKCFEIVEQQNDSQTSSMTYELADVIPSGIIDDDDISDEHDEHETFDADSDNADFSIDHDDIDYTDDEAYLGKKENALRLREILFYDDKISIFKARHGRI